MKVLDFSTSNAKFNDEIINVSDSNAIEIIHSLFYNKTGKLVEIWTGAGGTGTQLTETTDYTIGGAYADGDLPTSISPDVAYSTISIVNATYHSTDLYVSYYPIWDLVTAEKWNNDIPYTFLTGTGADFTFEKKRDYRDNKIFLEFTTDATARTITLPDPTDEFWRGVEITIKVVGSGAGQVTIEGPSSETINLTNGTTETAITFDNPGQLIITQDGTDYQALTNSDELEVNDVLNFPTISGNKDASTFWTAYYGNITDSITCIVEWPEIPKQGSTITITAGTSVVFRSQEDGTSNTLGSHTISDFAIDGRLISFKISQTGLTTGFTTFRGLNVFLTGSGGNLTIS